MCFARTLYYKTIFAVAFDGKNFPVFQNKNTDAENETTDEATANGGYRIQ